MSVDSESSELTTWGKSSKVKSLDVDDVDSRDVSQSSSELFSLVVNNDQRSLSHSVFLTSHLRDSCSDDFSVNDSLNVLVTSESLEESNGLLGLLDVVDLVVEDKRNLRDLVDLMTSGKDQWKNSGGRNS